MSVSWAEPVVPWDSGFLMIFSELDPDDEDDPTPSQTVCLHCPIEDGDEQLARGLERARREGQVDYDPATGEWFAVRSEGAA